MSAVIKQLAFLLHIQEIIGLLVSPEVTCPD